MQSKSTHRKHKKKVKATELIGKGYMNRSSVTKKDIRNAHLHPAATASYSASNCRPAVRIRMRRLVITPTTT